MDDSTRLSYDAVADDHARQLPGLDAETALDVAVLHDFADRCARPRRSVRPRRGVRRLRPDPASGT